MISNCSWNLPGTYRKYTKIVISNCFQNVKEANSPKKSAKTTKRKKEKTPDVDGVFDVESKEKEQTPSIQSEPSLSNQKKSLKREKRKSRTSPKSKDKKPNRRDLSPVPFPFIKDVEVDQKKEEEKDTVKPSVSPKVTSPSTSPAAPSVAPSPKRKEKKMKKKKSKKNKHKKSKKSSPRNLVSPHKITWGAQKESGSSNGTLDKLKDSKESKSKKMGNGEGEKWITTEVKVEEDTTNYRDSDDEMWCESSSSEDEGKIRILWSFQSVPGMFLEHIFKMKLGFFCIRFLLK